MKRWLFCFALLAAAACGERQSQPQQLVVMTMNMRYDNPEDGENNWRFRRERIAAMLREQAPDVFGTQELLANQYDDLGALLPDYRSVGVGREDATAPGSSMPSSSVPTPSNCSTRGPSGSARSPSGPARKAGTAPANAWHVGRPAARRRRPGVPLYQHTPGPCG